jgi:hypothetical protein
VSKTDKTAPYFRAIVPRGECPKECGGGYPCKHFSVSKSLGWMRKEMVRSERTRVRTAISRGDDPPVDQHRHRALWDVA